MGRTFPEKEKFVPAELLKKLLITFFFLQKSQKSIKRSQHFSSQERNNEPEQIRRGCYFEKGRFCTVPRSLVQNQNVFCATTTNIVVFCRGSVAKDLPCF